MSDEINKAKSEAMSTLVRDFYHDFIGVRVKLLSRSIETTFTFNQTRPEKSIYSTNTATRLCKIYNRLSL